MSTQPSFPERMYIKIAKCGGYALRLQWLDFGISEQKCDATL